MPTALPFAAQHRSRRVQDAATRHHANAMVQLVGGGAAFPAIYRCASPARSVFDGVATVAQHTLSMCTACLGDVAEGDELVLTTAEWSQGQRCQITTPVVPDAGGWADFTVVPIEVSDADLEGADHV